MKSLLRGGAALFTAAFATTLIFQEVTSVAEPLDHQEASQQQARITSNPFAPPGASAIKEASDSNASGASVPVIVEMTEEPPVMSPRVIPQSYLATAYSLGGRTASGRTVTRGLIAADPGVLPLGTRVRLEAGAYSGEYTVADTGGRVRGRKIDVWVPNTREAYRFGRRSVKLTVISYGARRRARSRR